MKILKYYGETRIPYALSNLTAGGSVIDVEDEIDNIKDPKDIMPTMAKLYSNRKIYDLPLEVKDKCDGVYRVKLQDYCKNISYLEIKA